MTIPPKHTGRKASTGITAILRSLAIGGSADVPIEWENRMTTPANRLGIRITTRRLGRSDTVTVYRIA